VTDRGIRLDVAAYEPTVLFDDGCSIVPSRASQYQWRAHRFLVSFPVHEM
jgi:hypothetical protein